MTIVIATSYAGGVTAVVGGMVWFAAICLEIVCVMLAAIFGSLRCRWPRFPEILRRYVLALAMTALVSFMIIFGFTYWDILIVNHDTVFAKRELSGFVWCFAVTLVLNIIAFALCYRGKLKQH